MGERGNKFGELIKRISQTDGELLQGVVKEVNGESCTVTVDELDYYNVRMQAMLVPEQKGFKVRPSIGSTVLIEKIKGCGDREYYVRMMSTIDALTVDIDTAKLFCDGDGFVIQKGDVKLRDILDAFMEQMKALNEEVQKIVVVIGVSPNVAALQAINNELTQIIQKSKDLLK